MPDNRFGRRPDGDIHVFYDRKSKAIMSIDDVLAMLNLHDEDVRSAQNDGFKQGWIQACKKGEELMEGLPDKFALLAERVRNT